MTAWLGTGVHARSHRQSRSGAKLTRQPVALANCNAKSKGERVMKAFLRLKKFDSQPSGAAYDGKWRRSASTAYRGVRHPSTAAPPRPRWGPLKNAHTARFVLCGPVGVRLRRIERQPPRRRGSFATGGSRSR